ncbi:MAG: hypothetical protein IKO90_01850 [Bacteroidales bacterium]|nr:hypothetical protein [Bacteroidales bacterium]
MDKNLVEIQKRAADVNRYVQAYDSQSVIPAIELDILLQKTRELYDLLSELKQVAPTEKVVESAEKPVEKPVEEQAPAEEQIIDVLSVKDEPVQEEQIPDPKVEEVSQPEPTPEPIEEQTTKREVFTPKQVTDLGTKLGKKPIAEIMGAIGINDRVRYRYVLFNRNQDLFENTIAVLNGLPNFYEAIEYLKKEFDWDFESADVQDFLAIVERRYL